LHTMWGNALYLLVEIVVVVVLEQVELVSGDGELVLELGDLVLQNGDDAQAAVHWVLFARVGLVRDGLHGVLALAGVHVLEDAQDVGDAEQLVHVLEPLGLVGREVGRQGAVRRALPALVLARRARRVYGPAGPCHLSTRQIFSTTSSQNPPSLPPSLPPYKSLAPTMSITS
jgi:hypothetical protein